MSVPIKLKDMGFTLESFGVMTLRSTIDDYTGLILYTPSPDDRSGFKITINLFHDTEESDVGLAHMSADAEGALYGAQLKGRPVDSETFSYRWNQIFKYKRSSSIALS